MTKLTVTGLTVKAGQRTLVDSASFHLESGELAVLLGPNGAGKTSLVRASLGLQKRFAGTVMLNEAQMDTLSPMERARQISYLPQTRPLAWPNTVRDVVALGRYGHGAAPGRLKSVDAQAVEDAISVCNLVPFAHRNVDTLSGGELARVHCARAFATRAGLLLADEPMAALDPRQQFHIMELIRSYVKGGGGALVILHDVRLAIRYASRLVWMKHGRLLADGSPSLTMTAEWLANIYEVRARVDGLNVEIDGPL